MSHSLESHAVIDPGDDDRQILWPASLKLGFRYLNGKTILKRGKSFGPLRVLKPFYPEIHLDNQNPCHITVLHPPGGVAGGDELVIELSAESQSHAVITTPAANKFYRSADLDAYQRQVLHVKANAKLEWLPQETLLFGGSRVNSETEINLEEGADFIAMELYGLGRPASQDDYLSGSFLNRFTINQLSAGIKKPLLHERLVLDATSAMMKSHWGLGGKRVFGSLYANMDDSKSVEQLRESLNMIAAKNIAVTKVNGIVIVRYLGQQIEEGLEVLRQAWAVLRPLTIACKACPPRIWKT